MAKRIAISLDEERVRLLLALRGFGNKEAEKVKNVLIAYLSEKGYLTSYNQREKP